MERPDHHHPGRHLFWELEEHESKYGGRYYFPAAPVIIENSYVTGPADLIDDPIHGNNVTVKKQYVVPTPSSTRVTYCSIGARVAYSEEDGADGPQASRLTLLGS